MLFFVCSNQKYKYCTFVPRRSLHFCTLLAFSTFFWIIYQRFYTIWRNVFCIIVWSLSKPSSRLFCMICAFTRGRSGSPTDFYSVVQTQTEVGREVNVSKCLKWRLLDGVCASDTENITRPEVLTLTCAHSLSCAVTMQTLSDIFHSKSSNRRQYLTHFCGCMYFIERQNDFLVPDSDSTYFYDDK